MISLYQTQIFSLSKRQRSIAHLCSNITIVSMITYQIFAYIFTLQRYETVHGELSILFGWHCVYFENEG